MLMITQQIKNRHKIKMFFRPTDPKSFRHVSGNTADLFGPQSKESAAQAASHYAEEQTNSRIRTEYSTAAEQGTFSWRLDYPGNQSERFKKRNTKNSRSGGTIQTLIEEVSLYDLKAFSAVIIMSPPKGRGTYCFWCGSCWRRRRCRHDTFLFARYLMNRLPDFN